MRLSFIAMATLSGLLVFGARASSQAEADELNARLETAVFAGGCFWCVEADFEKLDGVAEAVSGYTGGLVDNPTYEQVTYGDTGHLEAVRVAYDPGVVSYRELVDYFFRTIDPLDPNGQFCDEGPSYRTAIFAATADERTAALEAKAEAEEILGERVVTPVLDRRTFWVAEDYHQDYYKKNRIKYRVYRTGCGRDRRLKQLWGEDRA